MSLIERIIIDKDKVDSLESEILFQRHIERYALARKFLYGKVCDVASGVGYGSYLCSKNPDVESIYGFDIDADSVAHATEHFSSDKVEFNCKKIEDIRGNFDMLMSLETIEHLENPKILYDLVIRCNIKEVLISFPNKKTTHYNKWHLWDINSSDVKTIFNEFYIIDEFDFYDSKFMHLVKGRPSCKFLTKQVKLNDFC